MNEQTIIKNYYEYLSSYHNTNIKKVLYNEKDYLEIDMIELTEFNPDLYNLFLDDPVKQINLFKIVLSNFRENNEDELKFRLINLPTTENINLSQIRSQDIDKLVNIKGMIKRKSTALNKLEKLDYVCLNPSCIFSSESLEVHQRDDAKKTIKICPKCKSGLELIKEHNTDFMQIYIEELSDELEDGNILPEAKLIELKGDLVNPRYIDRFLVGSKAEVIGIIRKRSKLTNNKETTVATYYIEALNIISLEENVTNIVITEQDKKKFTELSKDPDLMRILMDSVAPQIAGRLEIKKATLAYIVGGSKSNDNSQKDLIHIITIGNASLGKSQILKRLKKLLPRTVYVSGENATAVGLVGAAVKDEFSGAWTIDAGAMAHANNGYFLLDEFDKIKRADQTKLNEALEHGECSITKAGIRATLKTYSPTYAVANPKNGKFKAGDDYISQITFDKTLLSRFDLVFILDGNDAEKENDDIINMLLKKKTNNKKTLDTEDLRKYLMYAKSFNPTMDENLTDDIALYFKNIQKHAEDTGKFDITYRQLGGLVRLSEAFAKIRLSNKVNNNDVKLARDLMTHTLNKFGVSEIETGVTDSERSLTNFILELLGSNAMMTIDDIILNIQTNNKRISEHKINVIIDKLKIDGSVYEPRKNHLMRAY